MQTLSSVKQKAIQEGWNLNPGPFETKDWAILNQYLHSKGIYEQLPNLLLRLASATNSVLDTWASFSTEDRDLGVYQYVTVLLNAGMSFGQQETITITSNSTIQICNPDGSFSYNSLTVVYDKPIVKFTVRYKQEGGLTKFTLTSPTFISEYSDGEREMPIQAKTICGQAVCGNSLSGYKL